MTKICKKCGIDKPLDEYHKSKAFVDGLNSSCSICVNEYNKIRNKEKRRLTKKDYTNVFFRLSNTPQRDYCSMFEFMSVIGYDSIKIFINNFVSNIIYLIKNEKQNQRTNTHTPIVLKLTNRKNLFTY